MRMTPGREGWTKNEEHCKDREPLQPGLLWAMSFMAAYCGQSTVLPKPKAWKALFPSSKLNHDLMEKNNTMLVERWH